MANSDIQFYLGFEGQIDLFRLYEDNHTYFSPKLMGQTFGQTKNAIVNSRTGLGVLGGVTIKQLLGIELGYNHFNKIHLANDSQVPNALPYSIQSQQKTIYIDAYLQYPLFLDESITPIIGAGLGFDFIEQVETEVQKIDAKKIKSTSYHLNVGSKFKLNDNFQLRVLMTYHFKNKDAHKNYLASKLGLIYHF